ncbi:MAG: type II toxin-antitoxin system VapC family toxin [Candidatus Saccharimonadales bacterium]
MIILDTNIFIYLAKNKLESHFVANKDIAHASIVKIEALGYGQISANELLLLKSLFSESYNLPLTDLIVERAVTLRQLKRMSLGDAIVAATAIENSSVLWTANTKDFKHIDELQLFDPMQK